MTLVRSTSALLSCCIVPALLAQPSEQGSCPGVYGCAFDMSSAVASATNPATCRLYVLMPGPYRDLRPVDFAAVINDAAEQQWIVDTFLSGAGSNRIIWVAASDLQVEGDWRDGPWWNSQPLQFTAWQPGQPDNAAGCTFQGNPTDEDYAAMNWHFAKGEPGAVRGAWSDVPWYGRRAGTTTGDCGEPQGSQYFWLREFDVPQMPANTPGPYCTQYTQVSGNATFHQAAILGNGPFQVQWQRNGVDLTDGPQPGGSVYAGTATLSFTLTGVTMADHGPFELRVSGPCGVTHHQFALYVNNLPGECDSIDFNMDGLFPDTADIDQAVCEIGYLGNDYNNDGLFPDFDDLEAFLRVFSGGPCFE